MNYNANVWYGKYGGCFIADAFSLACDRYAQEFQRITQSEAFIQEYAALKTAFEQPSPRFVQAAPGLTLCYAPENAGAILGTALLGKYVGRQAVCGVRYADEALLCARVCASLHVKLRLFLSRELAGLRTLTDQLRLLGAEYDTKMCGELFDLPEMYAFQEWVSAPDTKHLINCRSNVGAYPQTNIAAAFMADCGQKLMEAAQAQLGSIDRVVVPTISGSYALALTGDRSKKYVCVECDTEPELTEELDSYCGSFTKVLRNRYCDRVLAAELMDLADQGVVTRVQVAPEDAQAAMAQTPEALSLQSGAALSYCMAHPASGTTLCILRRQRWGAGL